MQKLKNCECQYVPNFIIEIVDYFYEKIRLKGVISIRKEGVRLQPKKIGSWVLAASAPENF